MQNEEIIQRLLKEGKGLTRTEQEKAAGSHDPAYIKMRIKIRQRQLNTARATIVLLYLGFFLGILLLLFGQKHLDPISLNWMVGVDVVVLALCFAGLPQLVSGQGRSILILRLIDFIRSNGAKR